MGWQAADERNASQISAKWLGFWLVFAVAVNVLSFCLLPNSAREATSFFERIAVAVDKARELPDATRSAIARVVDERHYRRQQPYSDPALEARQTTAVKRIEASLGRSKSVAVIEQPAP